MIYEQLICVFDIYAETAESIISSDMEIKIETNYLPLVRDSGDLPPGIEKRILPTVEKRSIDYDSIGILVLSFPLTVAGNILASWIYDRIKKVKDQPGIKLKINERKVANISKEEISIAIEREIELSSQ